MGMRHGELLVFFYDGLFSNMRQFVEMMCNGEFMNKSPDKAWDYFDLLVDNAQVLESTNTSERAKLGPSSKGGLYHLKEEDDVNARIARLTRKVEAIELGKTSEVKKLGPIESSCGMCETNTHLTKDCPTIPAFQELIGGLLVRHILKLIILIGETTRTLVGEMTHLPMNPKGLLTMLLM